MTQCYKVPVLKKIPILLNTKKTMDAKDVLYVPDFFDKSFGCEQKCTIWEKFIFDQHCCKTVESSLEVNPWNCHSGKLYVLDIEKTNYLLHKLFTQRQYVAPEIGPFE